MENKTIRLRLIILFIASLLLFCSCSYNEVDYTEYEQNESTEQSGIEKEEGDDMEQSIEAKQILLLSNTTTTCDELITEISDPQLFGRFRISSRVTGRGMTLEDLYDGAKIECLRVFEDYCYSIHKVTDTGYCISLFKYDNYSDTYIANNFFYVNKEYSVLSRFKELDQKKSFFSEAEDIDQTLSISKTDEMLFGITNTIENYEIVVRGILTNTEEVSTDILLVMDIEIIKQDTSILCTDILLPMDKACLGID